MESTYHVSDTSIDDPLFSHYASMIGDVVIPYQWEILNDKVEGVVKSHCLDNFRIAAHLKQGSFYGQIFQDSDVYKWLEALSYCLARGKAQSFSAIADEVVSLIEQAQQADGYLHTYYIINGLEKRWTNLIEGHELYCAGHLIEAAVAYHQATGKDRLLGVAMRFADLICSTFGAYGQQLHGYPGHEEIELALIKLYRHTKIKKYLDTAKYFIDIRGSEPNYFLSEQKARGGVSLYAEFRDYNPMYAQAHIRPVEQKTVEGHAVRAMYLLSAMADLAKETGDASYQKACLTLWKNLEEKRMFITGGIGSSGYLERFTTDYDLPNERAYCESCASVGLMMFGKRMAELTGEARFYDSVERALYNTVLCGIHHDGLHFFYVNPLEVWPEACMPYTSLSHVQPVRRQWFDVACCPTNIARTLANLSQYIYEAEGNQIKINQFIASTVRFTDPEGEKMLRLDVESTLRSKITLTVSAAMNVLIRIPSYAQPMQFLLDGKPIQPKIKKGYASISFTEPAVLTFDLGLKPVWMSAHSQVRADAFKVALTYGPFVYCLESEDNGNTLCEVGVDPARTPEVEGSLDSLPGNLPVLGYQACRLVRKDDRALYAQAQYSLTPVHMRAVPYCLWGNRKGGEMVVFQHLCPFVDNQASKSGRNRKGR